jgi:hypothetical protein
LNEPPAGAAEALCRRRFIALGGPMGYERRNASFGCAPRDPLRLERINQISDQE